MTSTVGWWWSRTGDEAMSEIFICPKCKRSYVTYTCPPMPECPIKVRNGWPKEPKR